MDYSQMLFRPAQPHQPESILVLLENSHALLQVWTDLRDQCFDRLVGEIYFAHSSVPIRLSVLESSHYGTCSFAPRQHQDYHDALRNADFVDNPENRISRGHIQSCIEFLDPAHVRGPAVASHLVIVAATAPSEDSKFYGNEHPSWVDLAHKMGSNNIHCHLVLYSANDMGSLTTLFEETLRVQGNFEKSLLLPVDLTHAVLRLSLRPKCDYYQDIGTSSSPSTITRGEILRRNSCPLDKCTEIFDGAIGTPHHPTEGHQLPRPPNQTMLQQVHRLSKKKVHSTKPSRQIPFRDERVKFRAPPAPLTMPLPNIDSVPFPTKGGRVISQSWLHRKNRVTQAPIPSDIHRRQRNIPKADHQTWPSSVHDELLVTPTDSELSALSSSSVSIPASIPPTHVVWPTYQNPDATKANWVPMHQQPEMFNPVIPPYTLYTPPSERYSENGFTPVPVVSQRPAIPSTYVTQTPSLRQIHHTPLSPPAVPSQALHQKATLTDPTTTPAARGPTDKLSALPPSLRKKTAQEDPDEERFSFSDDFVAATAALFEAEVLPAYPNYPGMSSGIFTNGNQEALSALHPAQTGELYASRDRWQASDVHPRL